MGFEGFHTARFVYLVRNGEYNSFQVQNLWFGFICKFSANKFFGLMQV